MGCLGIFLSRRGEVFGRRMILESWQRGSIKEIFFSRKALWVSKSQNKECKSESIGTKTSFIGGGKEQEILSDAAENYNENETGSAK